MPAATNKASKSAKIPSPGDEGETSEVGCSQQCMKLLRSSPAVLAQPKLSLRCQQVFKALYALCNTFLFQNAIHRKEKGGPRRSYRKQHGACPKIALFCVKIQKAALLHQNCFGFSFSERELVLSL